MSAVLEPQAPAAVPANDATVEVLDRAEINDGKALVQYSRTEAGLVALKNDLAGKVYDLTTVKGNELARQDRQRCVSLRTSLDKKRLEFKRPVLDIGKMIDAEAKRITDEILRLEAPIDAAIKADEARREQIRQEKAAAEAARQQRHRDGIAKIRSYADAVRRPDMTAERALKGLSALEAMSIDEAAWEEFHVEARHALAETIAAVKAERQALVTKEAEAARLAQQAKEQAERQAELDRIAREQAAAAAALAAQQAEITRQAEALAEQQRAAAAREAQRQKDSEERDSQQVLKAEPVTADATDRDAPADVSPRGGAMGAGQAAAAAPAGDEFIPVAEVIEHAEPPAVTVPVDDGREWKLGDLCTLFGKGENKVGLTADLIRALGIEPARIDKRAVIFTTSQVLDLQARFAAHVLSVEIA